jgi:putative tricarboxylic transport membrane protein
VLTGLFAVAELIDQASRLDEKLVRLPMAAAKLPTVGDFRKAGKSIGIGSVLGTFIGVLPALGATTAAIITYNEVRRFSRHKEEFGRGAIEGIAGPEAANNSAVGGSMVPTLALGIPGSATTAIILAGLLVQGVRPGPHLFNEQPQFLYAVFGSMLAANLIFLVLGLFLAKLFAMITLIPNALLWPGVLFCSVIGAYAPNQAMGDVWTMLAFGVIGFFFRRHGFSPAPLVMGLVLGQMVEESLKQSLLIFDQRWTGFLERPIAVTLFVVTLTLLALPALSRGIRALRARAA